MRQMEIIALSTIDFGLLLGTYTYKCGDLQNTEIINNASRLEINTSRQEYFFKKRSA